MAGLNEAETRDADKKYEEEHDKRILALLDRRTPVGYANWTAPLMARELLDVYEQYIWRFLRARTIPVQNPTTTETSPKAPRLFACGAFRSCQPMSNCTSANRPA